MPLQVVSQINDYCKLKKFRMRFGHARKLQFLKTAFTLVSVASYSLIATLHKKIKHGSNAFM